MSRSALRSETSKMAPTSTHHKGKANGSVDKPKRKEPPLAQKGRVRKKYHFNNIWSIWYCILTLAFTAYLVYINVERFLIYASLPWPGDEQPYLELNAHVGLVGAAVVVMPFFIVSGILKVGNLPNDGFKLGATLSTCSRDPPSILQPTTGIVRNLWMHGVPTAPFLHLVAGFCLLLPRVIMDASLIRAGFLSKGEIWRSDLDIFIPHSSKPLIFTNASSPLVLQDPAALDAMLLRIQGTSHQPQQRAPFKKRSAAVVWDDVPEVFPQSLKMGRKKNKSKDHSLKMAATSTPVPETWQRPRPELKSLQRSLFVWKPFSPEMLNYALALLVFSIRYSSVFWSTSKKFSTLFSAQLLINGIQTIMTLASFSILYKLEGNEKNVDYAFDSLILCQASSLALVVFCVLIVTTSSSALYFYGFERFTRFLSRSRRRFHITFNDDPVVARPHTAQLLALLTLILMGGCYGPLLWDLTVLYNGSSDGLILAALVSTIVYLFWWILLWLILSVKTRWTFKLRVTVARAFVSTSRSIKLVNDVEMAQPDNHMDDDPLLIVGNGKAYAIQDKTPQKAIFEVLQKTREEKKAHGQEEDIYWLRPSLSRRTPNGGQRRTPATRSAISQPKVTFNDTVQEGPSRTSYLEDTGDSDDQGGDYALLRRGGPSQDEEEESSGSESSMRFHQEDPRYVDRNQILAYRQARSQLDDTSPSSPELVAPDYEETDHFDEESSLSPRFQHHMLLDAQGPLTPRSNRSTDSGVPPEIHSHRSDSLSSGSSNSPPENSEESGIHPGVPHFIRHRSNSFDDLTQLPSDHQRGANTPSLHPSIHRPPLMNISGPYGYCRNGRSAPPSAIYRPSEGTVAIRRQRHLTQEIKPPLDPIYGTRKLTSFTDNTKEEVGKLASEDAMANAQNAFNSSQSNSSGYHSNNASSSSASNSASNSPVPPSPYPNTESSARGQLHGEHIIYGTKSTQRSAIPHTRINLQDAENPYGQRLSSGGSNYFKYPQAPQIPLPPIPQGVIAPSFHPPSDIPVQHGDLYGRTTGPQFLPYPHFDGSKGVFGAQRNVAMGRSSSLRYPTNSAVQKQYTNTLPHVLPKESYFNTNV